MALQPIENKKGLVPYLRGKGAIVGAKITFISLFLIPVAFAIAFAVNGPAPLLLALIPFLIGLGQMLYAVIFGKNSASSETKPRPAALSEKQAASLTFDFSSPKEMPPITNELLVMPASSKVETYEFSTPPSVTEETTRHLEKTTGQSSADK